MNYKQKFVSNYKKYTILPIALLTLVGGTIVVASTIKAQETTPVTSIVQKIADRFGLSKDDVQKVFDEEKEARKAEMEANFEQKLTDAVTNGELTEEKKQLILAKHKEIENQMQANIEDLKK